MSNKKVLLVINPKAGVEVIKDRTLDIISVFNKAGYETSVYVTQAPRDGTRYVSEVGSMYDIVVACGGDGTMHEVADGILNLEKKPAFAVMPCGSMNDFASTLGMPNDLVKCAEAIVEGEVFNCDIGYTDDDRFIYAAAFGIFTEITFETPQYLKNAIGSIAYAVQGVMDLPTYKYHRLKVEYEGGSIEDDFALGLISNTTSIAGMRKLFDSVSSLEDGMIELMLLKIPTNIEDVVKALRIINHLEPIDAEEVKRFAIFVQTPWAKITSDEPLKWLADGEANGVRTTTEIRVDKGALPTIRATRSYED